MRRLLALLLPALAACGAPAQAPPPQGRQMLEDFTMSQSYRGATAWTLKSELAIIEDRAREAALSAPHMEFYRDGKLASRVDAAKGTAALDSRDVLLSSGVVAASLEDRSTLTTEWLRYSNSRKKFFTDARVTLAQPGAVLRGEGLEAEPDLSQVRIFNQESVIRKSR